MITLAGVQEALQAIRERAAPTPLICSAHFSRVVEAPVSLKLENLDQTDPPDEIWAPVGGGGSSRCHQPACPSQPFVSRSPIGSEDGRSSS